MGLKRDGRYKVWVNAAAEGGISPDSEVLFAVVVDRSKIILRVNVPIEQTVYSLLENCIVYLLNIM